MRTDKKQPTDAKIFDAYEGKGRSQTDVAKQFGISKGRVQGALKRERKRRFQEEARPITQWLRDVGRVLNQLDDLVTERRSQCQRGPAVFTSEARAAVYRYAYEHVLGDADASAFLHQHTLVSPWCPPMWNWHPEDEASPNGLRRVK